MGTRPSRSCELKNKANLRDLIAAFDRPSNLKFHRFFSPCDLEIWWMTSKNNRALLLYYVKLCASFQIHPWSQAWVTVRKRSNRVKIGDFFALRDLEIRWYADMVNFSKRRAIWDNWRISLYTTYPVQLIRFIVNQSPIMLLKYACVTAVI